jgi:hypothetical protein
VDQSTQIGAVNNMLRGHSAETFAAAIEVKRQALAEHLDSACMVMERSDAAVE